MQSLTDDTLLWYVVRVILNVPGLPGQKLLCQHHLPHCTSIGLRCLCLQMAQSTAVLANSARVQPHVHRKA